MRARRDIPRTAGPARLLLCSVFLALAVACQPHGPDASFQTYLETLSAALSVSTPAFHSTRLPSLPAADELRLNIPGGSLDRLDFLLLSGCAVQATVIKRNSSLGRAAKPSQRLLLALEYLRLAPQCIMRLRASYGEALAATLQEAWRLQREQLPALIFNATLGSEEYRAFWLHPGPGEYPRVNRSVALSALDAINHHVQQWLAGDYRVQNRDFEILLGEVAGGRGSALVEALSRQGDWLTSADRMVERRAAHGLACFPNQRGALAEIPTAAIHQSFVDTLQRRTARLERRYHQLMPLITGLENQLGTTLPEHYRRWMEQRNRQLASYVDAPHHHLQQLARLQQRCSAGQTERPALPVDNWLY